MSEAMNRLEDDILRLEREVMQIHGALVPLETWRISALEQGLAASWFYAGLDRRYTATISGQVNGCSAQGFPGATFVVNDPGTGEQLASGTADGAGAFSATLTISGLPPRTLSVTATPAGAFAARFAGPGTITPSIVEGANTLATMLLNPATDFCCVPAQYYPDPLSKTVCITVRDACTSTGLPGATVDIKLGGVTVDSGTTNGSGVYCGTVSVGGAYTFAASKTGFAAGSGSASPAVSCSAGATAIVNLNRTTTSLTVTVNGCSVTGASVVAKQGGVTVASGTTSGAGTVTLTGIPTGVSTVLEVSATGFNTSTQALGTLPLVPFSICSGSNFTVNLTVATGYVCTCIGPNGAGLVCVAPTTLTLSDSFFGTTTTVTYDPLSGTWKGTSAPVGFGCPNCPAGSGTIDYEFGLLPGSVCGVAITTNTYLPGGIYGLNRCPGSGGPTGLVVPATAGTCGPFSVTALVTTSNVNPAFANIYCAVGPTLSTLTITP
jgi:hypothetical protein